MVPIVNRSEDRPASGDGGAPADRPDSGQEPAGSPREEGHRLRADARRNRDQILKAAEAVFADHGPGAPIDDVARRAGLGVGTLYRHFPTKEALFEAIVLERIRGLAGEARALWAAPDPGSALFCYLSRVFDQVLATKALAGALASTGVDLVDKRRSPVWQDVWHELREATQKLLTRAQEAGDVRADVRLADLMGMVSGICHALSSESSEGGVSAQRMLAVVYDGLRAPGSEGPPSSEPPLRQASGG